MTRDEALEYFHMSEWKGRLTFREIELFNDFIRHIYADGHEIVDRTLPEEFEIPFRIMDELSRSQKDVELAKMQFGNPLSEEDE